MPIHTVTLTGVDEYTNFGHLRAIAASYPFVEFGILLDYTFAHRIRDDYSRYPDLDYIDALLRRKEELGAASPRLALHLCGGRAIEEFLENVTSVTTNLAKRFDRVQLNADFAQESVSHIDWSVGLHKPQTIIMQNGDYLSRDHWNGMRNSNHAILFDTSQGMGRLPESWPEPLAGKACGYAGGLGPENITEQLPLINTAASGRPYWIDMESSLRDESDRFSIPLCRAVLQKVKASGLLIPQYQ